MDSQANKAHRPSQSGAKAEKKKASKGKGKEKQHGFNEKVRQTLPTIPQNTFRHMFRFLAT